MIRGPRHPQVGSRELTQKSRQSASYDPKVKKVAPWQANHPYSVGDQFVTGFEEVSGLNFTDVSHRRWYVHTAHTSGSDAAVGCCPDKSIATDALYARTGDPTRSTLELEGAVSGPSTGRIMGVVVWDNGLGSLTFIMRDSGDVELGAQRHLLSGAGSGTGYTTPATTVVAAVGAGTSPPAPGLAENASDMRGVVYGARARHR